MLIEASGVSEPAEIATMFKDCTDDHDHEETHEGNIIVIVSGYWILQLAAGCCCCCYRGHSQYSHSTQTQLHYYYQVFS